MKFMTDDDKRDKTETVRPKFDLAFSDDDHYASYQWRWSELPRKQWSGYPWNFEGFKIELADGRTISLEWMRQFKTDYYSPLSLGVPSYSHPEDYVSSAIQHARKLADWIETPPIVLAPTLYELTSISRDEIISRYKTASDLGLGDRALVLPRVYVISQFDSCSSAEDTEECMSSLLIIWYQDNFGEIPADIQSQLAQINWKNSAYGWDP